LAYGEGKGRVLKINTKYSSFKFCIGYRVLTDIEYIRPTLSPNSTNSFVPKYSF